MPAIIAHNLSYQLDTGEWLFRNIHLTLTAPITGMVGRNGAGKSLLLSMLLGNVVPTHGSVTCQGKVGHYSQLPSHLLEGEVSIGDFLGIQHKLEAIKAIEQGHCEQPYFNAVGEDWDIEARTVHRLEQLKIPRDLNTCCSCLSGGQLALLQLHKLFESDADLLLLDEPSNHLDVEGRKWLIEQCQRFNGKIILVSHDRHLLRAANGIYQLTSLGLTYYKGNYDCFAKQSATKTLALDKQIAHLESNQKRIERQVQENKEKAQQREAQGNRMRKSGSQPKILMDAMKDKAGQRRSSALKNAQNQLSRNQKKLDELKHQKESVKPQAMYLQEMETVKKRTLLNIKECVLGYGSKQPISFQLTHGERCYLKGANGCGKSTLLQAIQGKHSHYQGKIKVFAKTVYLDQHFALLTPEDSMLESLQKNSHGLTESDARILLASIGFRRDSVFRRIAVLSGGEKMKLAMLMVSHMPDSALLLLDEPDNHLDLESKQLLASALSDYKGAFILVSHDMDFVTEAGISRTLSLEEIKGVAKP